MQAITKMLFLVGSMYVIYRNRFRIINTLLEQPWIRKYTVSTMMQVPFLRNKVLKYVI